MHAIVYATGEQTWDIDMSSSLQTADNFEVVSSIEIKHWTDNQDKEIHTS